MREIERERERSMDSLFLTQKGGGENTGHQKNGRWQDRGSSAGGVRSARDDTGAGSSACVLLNSLFKVGEGDNIFDVRVRDVHAGSDVEDVLVGLLDFRVVLNHKVHSHVVDFVGQDNVTRVGEGAVGAHLNKVLVVLVDGLGGDTRSGVGSPVISVQVPEDSSQVELGSDPADTVVKITESLKNN